jgi:hypothetical protein
MSTDPGVRKKKELEWQLKENIFLFFCSSISAHRSTLLIVVVVFVAVVMLCDNDACGDADGDNAGSKCKAIPALVVFAFIFRLYLLGA